MILSGRTRASRGPRVHAVLAAIALLPVLGCAPDPATGTATVDGERFAVDIARTDRQLRTGLSGRDDLPAGTGMLFDFGTHRPQQVWMPEMKFPLDVAWIADGAVLEVRTLPPCAAADRQQCPRWDSPGPVDAMLEVPAGSLQGVDPGAVVTVDEDPD